MPGNDSGETVRAISVRFQPCERAQASLRRESCRSGFKTTDERSIMANCLTLRMRRFV